MLYAALDTATDVGSVAVGTPGGPVSLVTVGRRRHAGELVPALARALHAAGADWADLGGMVVADGPGSFTGLRIAFATALGIARQCPGLIVVTVPSLVAAAYAGSAGLSEAGCGLPVAALYDALRGAVYAAVCDVANGGRLLVPPTLTTVGELQARGVRAGIAVGDGAHVHAEAVRRWTGRPPAGPPEGAPRAGALVALVGSPHANRVLDLARWEPVYGRPAEAQLKWERTHGRALPDPAGS